MMRMQDTHSEQDEDDSSTLSLLNWCLLCGDSYSSAHMSSMLHLWLVLNRS